MLSAAGGFAYGENVLRLGGSASGGRVGALNVFFDRHYGIMARAMAWAISRIDLVTSCPIKSSLAKAFMRG